MKNTFRLIPLPTIHFGPGTISEIADSVSAFSNSVLLITGKRSLKDSAYWEDIVTVFEMKNIQMYHEQIEGEPSPQVIDLFSSRYRKIPGLVVAAIGGGSVLDGGKAVSAMLGSTEESSVSTFLEGVGSKQPDGKKVPFIAVPTTAGTGSEMTKNAVISDVGSGGFKKSLRHDNYVPDVAIVDPLLTAGSPVHIKAACSLDAFTQLVESYLSVMAIPYTDDIGYGALKRYSRSLEAVCKGSDDISHLINMSYGAMVSGITLAQAGLGVVHGFASIIGGLHSIPHGVACGTLMGAANDVTLQKLRKSGNNHQPLRKYTELGKIFSRFSNKSDEFYQDSFIAFLHELIESSNVKRLSEYGLNQDDIRKIAAESGSKNNPLSLDEEEKYAILHQRL